jgi:hypothetical protein
MCGARRAAALKPANDGLERRGSGFLRPEPATASGFTGSATTQGCLVGLQQDDSRASAGQRAARRKSIHETSASRRTSAALYGTRDTPGCSIQDVMGLPTANPSCSPRPLLLISRQDHSPGIGWLVSRLRRHRQRQARRFPACPRSFVDTAWRVQALDPEPSWIMRLLQARSSSSNCE